MLCAAVRVESPFPAHRTSFTHPQASSLLFPMSVPPWPVSHKGTVILSICDLFFILGFQLLARTDRCTSPKEFHLRVEVGAAIWVSLLDPWAWVGHRQKLIWILALGVLIWGLTANLVHVLKWQTEGLVRGACGG